MAMVASVTVPLSSKVTGDNQMAGHGEKFGRKKEAAIAALLTARNNEEAAKTIGVSPKTLLQWQKLPSDINRSHPRTSAQTARHLAPKDY